MKPTELTVDDYQDMVQLFHNESERGAAVLAGSYIESYLGLFLESLVVDKSLSKQIFDGNGFLATFAQRTDFAQAFGVLGKTECAQLNLIRKIRNYFAHHPKSASFAAPPVSDWVRELDAKAVDRSGHRLIDKGEDGKLVYLLTIGMLVLSLQPKPATTSPSAD